MANRTAYMNDYKRNHVKRIAFEIPLEGEGKLTYADFVKALDLTGETTNGFIKKAIEMRMTDLDLL